jgi:hypothetical protein
MFSIPDFNVNVEDGQPLQALKYHFTILSFRYKNQNNISTISSNGGFTFF